MSDADLIYSALLRAERAMETQPGTDPTCTPEVANLARFIIQVIRTEIGRGMAREGRTLLQPKPLSEHVGERV